MQIENTLIGAVKVIYPIAPSLDANNVDSFRKQVSPLLSDSIRVVIDLGKIEFVDSAGIGALISCLRIAGENKAQLVLCGLNRPVKALFDLMRMHRVFEIHEDRVNAAMVV
jgi:anti-sigma B factor antagonist